MALKDQFHDKARRLAERAEAADRETGTTPAADRTPDAASTPRETGTDRARDVFDVS
ncbi:hypothetical protein ACN20G_15285 [Streptomyces sp. BI20]|uniref:hypothetical protein n=1 Tax=Streptomyces sp. BI20 TaxID=3403460 RepID=UPI003C78EE4F